MADKRTDSGQFYPGGRVMVKHGTEQSIATVSWANITGKPNFSEIADLTTHDSTGKVKEVVNTIKNKMGGTGA